MVRALTQQCQHFAVVAGAFTNGVDKWWRVKGVVVYASDIHSRTWILIDNMNITASDAAITTAVNERATSGSTSVVGNLTPTTHRSHGIICDGRYNRCGLILYPVRYVNHLMSMGCEGSDGVYSSPF